MNLDFEKCGGLVPVVVQDITSREVLMVAFANADAWQHTEASGHATFWSRSRQKLWVKGESSGHTLVVREVRTDCDRDAVLLLVEPQGPGVCHQGYRSCFFQKLDQGEWLVDDQMTFDPKETY